MNLRFLLLAIAFAFAHPLVAETVRLSAGGVEYTWLDASHPDVSYGGSPELRLGTAETRGRALLRFALLPENLAGKRVTAARLALTLRGAAGDWQETPVEIHRVAPSNRG